MWSSFVTLMLEGMRAFAAAMPPSCLYIESKADSLIDVGW